MNTEDQPTEIHARIELTAQDGNKFVTADMHSVTDEENRAVVFARWIGRNLYNLQEIAWRENQLRKASEKPTVIVPTPRLAGPDGKPIN